MMNYQQTLDYLYTETAVFQHDGPSAYKPGLDRVRRLAAMFGEPHLRFPAIHVGGTNGKGSTAHTLAAVLQSAGYRVGLFTSPHLVDFRERIRINGQMIPQREVVDFVERWLALNAPHEGEAPLPMPSFFELTTMMAFDYFAREKVDVAVIEVGLGGRLDSTNIITPILSVITNISLDHTALLGDTLVAIASEKAGIIKPGVPVVIGESGGDVREVFAAKAAEVGAPIIFTDETFDFTERQVDNGLMEEYPSTPFGRLVGELTGDCQRRNAATIIAALVELRALGWKISDEAVRQGFAKVSELTGLMGRWSVLRHDPMVVCDTGHNTGGWHYLGPKLSVYGNKLRMVVGFAGDKDVSHILAMMPREAKYYFAKASVNRAMPSDKLAEMAAGYGLRGEAYPSVDAAYHAALEDADEGDVVFVGGSNFVVGDLLAALAE